MESDLVKLEEHIAIIFKDLISSGYIDPESRYYSQAKERCLKTCSHFYPLLEFLPNDESSNTFLLYTSYLGAWTYFLDDALDYSECLSQKVQANQISSYLLLRYFNWVRDYEPYKAIDSFHDNLQRYSDYLIAEKKWEYPQYYQEKYGSIQSIHNKAIICFFPIDLLSRKQKNFKTNTIKELFYNYFSFLLLADDLTDVEDDIKSKCLTYPIIKYYERKGILPSHKTDLEFLVSEFMDDLYLFANKIEKLKTHEGWNIEIINNNLKTIFSFLNVNQIML